MPRLHAKARTVLDKHSDLIAPKSFDESPEFPVRSGLFGEDTRTKTSYIDVGKICHI